jgi:predicted nucleic acid-binding protein
MTLVLDASLTMSWYFDDESTATTDGLLDQVADTGALVPTVWRLEVANALQMAVRRNRIDTGYRDRALTELALLPIAIDADTDTYAWSTTLRLAERFALTIYDAAYLELAQRRSLPLATLDEALGTAAGTLGTRLLGTKAQ